MLSGRDQIQLTATDTREKNSLRVSDPVRDSTKEIVEAPLLNLAKNCLDSVVRKIFFTERVRQLIRSFLYFGDYEDRIHE